MGTKRAELREGRNLDPSIGYWLSGFADGEGHFAVVKQYGRNKTTTYGCRFIIALRDDDEPTLQAIQAATGLGKLYRTYTRKVGQQQIIWVVSRQDEIPFVVDIFEQFPLWTSKRDDFAIWAKAVRYLVGPKPEGQAPLARWFEEIRAVRKYDAPEVPDTTFEHAAYTLFDDPEEAAEPGEDEQPTTGTVA